MPHPEGGKSAPMPLRRFLRVSLRLESFAQNDLKVGSVQPPQTQGQVQSATLPLLAST